MDNIDTAGYADDITPYKSADNIDEVVPSLEQAANILFKW